VSVDDVQLHEVVVSVTEHNVVTPSRTTTVAPISPTPENVGVGPLTVEPAAGAVSVTLVTVSTVKLRTSLETEVLPAASVAVMVTVCAPSSSEGDAQVQTPVALAVTVHAAVALPSRYTRTVLLFSAVPAAPEIVGVEVATVADCAGAVIDGFAGATVSMVNVTEFDAAEP
jgi:hypothetical protein